jgi:hypothetical protein
MNTKKFCITAFAVAALLTASFSNVFSLDKETSLKCYDDRSFYCPDDSTKDDEDGNGGGPIIIHGGN